MLKRGKKALSVLLAFVLLASLLVGTASAAGVVASGNGWTLDSNGLLELSGHAGPSQWSFNLAAQGLKVKSVNVAADVDLFPGRVFVGCTNLTSITFADGIQLPAIGESNFQNCTRLAEITIPASVTSIGRLAFSGCTGLNSITFLSENPPEIGENALADTSANLLIYVPGQSVAAYKAAVGEQYARQIVGFGEPLHSGEGWTLDAYGNLNITDQSGMENWAANGAAYRSDVVNVSLMGNVTAISSQAFEGAVNLMEIRLPSTVTSIGASAFAGSGLTGFACSANLTSVGEKAFSGCTAMEKITIEDVSTALNFGNSCFENCTGLTVLTFPQQRARFGNAVFSGCTNLISMTFTGYSVFRNGSELDGTPDSMIIYVPEENLSEYRSDLGSHASKLQAIPKGYDTGWYDAGLTTKTATLTTAEQLKGLAQLVNSGNTMEGWTITLGADIALDTPGKFVASAVQGVFGNSSFGMKATYYTMNADAKIWTPIGTATATSNTAVSNEHYFAGTFDGDGHTVSGVYTNGTLTVQGLFGCVSGTIRNLTVEGGIAAKYLAGGVAAYLNGGTIENCVNHAIVYADGGEVVDSLNETGLGFAGALGGIAGCAMGSNRIAGCENYGVITCTNANGGGRVGGILGLVEGAGPVEVTSCVNYGDIDAYRNTGGIVGASFGSAAAAPIRFCANHGSVTAHNQKNSYVGGIISVTSSDIIACYNTGVCNVQLYGTAADKGGYLGGIVAELSNTARAVNCYNATAYSNTGRVENPGSVCGTGYANLVNCYSFVNGGVDIANGYVTFVTPDDARLPGFAAQLNGEEDVCFVADRSSSPINSGYPILLWQALANGVTYTAAFDADEHAVVKVNGVEKESVEVGAGESLSFTVETDSDYELESVQINEDSLAVLAGTNGSYTLSDMIGGVTVTITTKSTGSTGDSGSGSTGGSGSGSTGGSGSGSTGGSGSGSTGGSGSGSTGGSGSGSTGNSGDSSGNGSSSNPADGSTPDSNPVEAFTTTLESGTATVMVNHEVLTQKLADTDVGDSVIIPVSIPDGESVRQTVTVLTRGSVGEIAQAEASLTVRSPLADIVLSDAALQNVAGGKGQEDEEITITTALRDSGVLIEVAANGEALNKLEGGLLVSLPTEAASDGSVMILVDADGGETVIKKSVADESAVTALLDGSCTVKVVDNAKSFADIDDGEWYAEAVAFVTARELYNGIREDCFAPDEAMSRAMLVTVLHRLEDTPGTDMASGFSDVADGTWYTEAVAWASENGIVEGYGNGIFDTNANITREQIAVILYRYAGYIGLDISTGAGGVGRFDDADQISDWAAGAVEWAVDTGLITGYENGLIQPGSAATRAEAATILQRLITLMVK